jgi:hypothetical protein
MVVLWCVPTFSNQPLQNPTFQHREKLDPTQAPMDFTRS